MAEALRLLPHDPFILSVADYFRHRRFISPKQREHVERNVERMSLQKSGPERMRAMVKEITANKRAKLLAAQAAEKASCERAGEAGTQ